MDALHQGAQDLMKTFWKSSYLAILFKSHLVCGKCVLHPRRSPKALPTSPLKPTPSTSKMYLGGQQKVLVRHSGGRTKSVKRHGHTRECTRATRAILATVQPMQVGLPELEDMGCCWGDLRSHSCFQPKLQPQPHPTHRALAKHPPRMHQTHPSCSVQPVLGEMGHIRHRITNGK